MGPAYDQRQPDPTSKQHVHLEQSIPRGSLRRLRVQLVWTLQPRAQFWQPIQLSCHVPWQCGISRRTQLDLCNTVQESSSTSTAVSLEEASATTPYEAVVGITGQCLRTPRASLILSAGFRCSFGRLKVDIDRCDGFILIFVPHIPRIRL